MNINDIPPYVVKHFQILPSKVEDNILYVDFVKSLTKEECEEIKSLINVDDIKTETRISWELFDKRINEKYNHDISTKRRKNLEEQAKPETTKRQDQFEPDEPENKNLLERNKTRTEKAITKADKDDDMLNTNNPVVFTDDEVDTPITMEDFLSGIQLETLEKEIRKRYLNRDMSGKLIISNDNKVQFQLDELNWPAGIFNIKIIYESEVDSSTLVIDNKGEDNNAGQ